MSQFPPPSSPPPGPIGYSMPGAMGAQRTSGAAVASLICGILGCLVITGIIAVITGIIGLKATKDPNVKGRGLAITGIILGLLFGILGAGCFATTTGAAIWGYKQIAPAIETTNGLTKAIAAGDTAAAMQYVDTSTVTQAEVDNIIAQLKPLGQPDEFTPTKMDANANSGVMVVNLAGTLSYPNNVIKSIDATLTKQSDGKYKVTSLDIK